MKSSFIFPFVLSALFVLSVSCGKGDTEQPPPIPATGKVTVTGVATQ